MEKPILLTGMRPTGELHIGNYFGAIRPLVKFQKKYNEFVMIADLHALTTIEDTGNIRNRTLTNAALYIAFGIDPNKSTIFVQSHIPEHAELAVLLGMITPLSMVELNPVYKEMLEEHPKKRTLGLLGYPVLQAADILLYKPLVVPVGKDQAPHIEITREIARKFNRVFGKTFPEPKTLLSEGEKIMSLVKPGKKMSKSHGSAAVIGLLDNPAIIKKKIRSAVTDSDSEIRYDPKKKPGISNLIMLYHLILGTAIPAVEKRFRGKGYGEFKEALAGALIKQLADGQKHYKELMQNKRTLTGILNKGDAKARKIAKRTLQEAHKKAGLAA